jgi:hypothetical protein
MLVSPFARLHAISGVATGTETGKVHAVLRSLEDEFDGHADANILVGTF